MRPGSRPTAIWFPDAKGEAERNGVAYVQGIERRLLDPDLCVAEMDRAGMTPRPQIEAARVPGPTGRGDTTGPHPEPYGITIHEFHFTSRNSLCHKSISVGIDLGADQMSGHDLHFVAMACSLRRGSYTCAIADTLDELAPDDVAVEVISSLGDLPLYNQDFENAGVPAAVAALAAEVASADAVVIVTPEYNRSVPAALKNAIDWLSRLSERPLEQKPVAIQSASPGLLGGARAQEHLRQILSAVDAVILNRPQVVVTQVAAKVDAQSGMLRDRETRQQVTRQLQALAHLARSPRSRLIQNHNVDAWSHCG